MQFICWLLHLHLESLHLLLLFNFSVQLFFPHSDNKLNTPFSDSHLIAFMRYLFIVMYGTPSHVHTEFKNIADTRSQKKVRRNNKFWNCCVPADSLRGTHLYKYTEKFNYYFFLEKRRNILYYISFRFVDYALIITAPPSLSLSLALSIQPKWKVKFSVSCE